MQPAITQPPPPGIPAVIAANPVRLHAFLRQQLDARPPRASWRQEQRWDVVADERGILHLWEVTVRIITFQGLDYLVDPPRGALVDGQPMTTRPFGLAEVDQGEGIPPRNRRERLHYLAVAASLPPRNAATRARRAWSRIRSLGLPREG